MSKFFITTAIPYVNAKPHVGFALELVQADVIARAHREIGDTVYFLTGTDENSIKNVQAAEKAGIPVNQFVDENAQVFKDLTGVLNISNDDFIRTTETRHHLGAQKLWDACFKRGDIDKRSYEGLYCTGCEAFYLEKDLENGHCPEHKTRPETIKEENYFFNLKNYARFLKNAYAKKMIRIHPQSRGKETLNFIEQGLEDFSISRSNSRAKNWGIPVPGDGTQMMYVWFDALANYITALGYRSDDDAKFKDLWMEGNVLHVIGKGITKFHAIYWPAMLESAGIFPKNGLDIVVHGYVTVDGEKISKSLGNTVDPFALVEKYGVDAVRYFLLREIPATEDGDYSEEKFRQRFNTDLANGLGNLVQRVTTLTEKTDLSSLVRTFSRDGDKIRPETTELLSQESTHLRSGEFHLALADIWAIVANANQYVDWTKPWQKIGSDLEWDLSNLTFFILAITKALQPFLPNAADNIFKRFGVVSNTETIDASLKLDIKKGEPLFKRL